jgi:hypothetical protein
LSAILMSDLGKDNTTPYLTQLKPKAAKILHMISTLPRANSYADSKWEITNRTGFEGYVLVTGFDAYLERLVVDSLLDHLIEHQFIETKGSLSPGKHHPKLLLRDFPFRMFLQISQDSSENAIKSLAGYLFEEIIYLSWKEKLGKEWEVSLHCLC